MNKTLVFTKKPEIPKKTLVFKKKDVPRFNPRGIYVDNLLKNAGNGLIYQPKSRKA